MCVAGHGGRLARVPRRSILLACTALAGRLSAGWFGTPQIEPGRTLRARRWPAELLASNPPLVLCLLARYLFLASAAKHKALNALLFELRIGARARREKSRSPARAGRKPLMTQMDRTAETTRLAVDRTRSGRHGGSVSLVLFVAVVLAGAGAGLLLVGRANAEPYILALLAVLAMAGVFLLLALAAGILRMSGTETVSPLHQVRGRRRPRRHPGDRRGRARGLRQCGLSRAGRAPRRQTTCARSSGSSSAIRASRRRSIVCCRAAREGRRLQEEVRRRRPQAASAGRWLRMRVRPLGEGKRERA